jgi:hypothetical protein
MPEKALVNCQTVPLFDLPGAAWRSRSSIGKSFPAGQIRHDICLRWAVARPSGTKCPETATPRGSRCSRSRADFVLPSGRYPGDRRPALNRARNEVDELSHFGMEAASVVSSGSCPSREVLLDLWYYLIDVWLVSSRRIGHVRPVRSRSALHELVPGGRRSRPGSEQTRRTEIPPG